MKVSNSIVAFLTSKRDEHNGKDLLDFYLSHGTNLETQVNVAAGNGSPVQGRKSTFTDGLNEWWSIRIPKKADSDPEWNEYDLKWPLELHAELIGSTGWNWRTKRSLYVGFDFDAIAGHAKGVGLTAEQLEKIRQTATSLPYVQVRRSTAGAGYHLYVFFEGDGVPTSNHTEHAALARCILGLMSAEAGFNFASQIDACGGNMWLWGKKSTPENHGLELVKPAEAYPLAKVPDNWRDHVDVVTRTRSKTRVGAVPEGKLDIFEALASAHRVVPLEQAHKDHMDEILRMGFVCTWQNDHNMLQTHTYAFKRLMEEMRDEYHLEGFFDTNSQGKDPNTPNCFAFPGDFGSWKIYRFSPGIAEAKTWEQDGQGWTTCWFNRKPNLKAAARALGGRDLKKGGYEFDTLEQAAQVAKALGSEIKIEPSLAHRKAVVSKSKDGRLTVEIPKTADDKIEGDWNSSDKKNAWTQVFDVPTEPVKEEISDFDNRVRALKTPDGDRAGWAVKEDAGEWNRSSSSDVKTVLQSFGLAKPEAEVVMGTAVRRSWKLVSLPFQPEYPGDRQWNLNAPQLVYPPAPRGDNVSHPTWDAVLDHAGRDLDPEIKNLEWAKEVNIRTGGDYLRAWYACIIKDPGVRLPYLFFFGDENCGKTMVWEAFSLLVTKGVVKADRALTSQNDFNGELAGAILCVVEEKDISKSPGAAAKIKDAVTGLVLSIRRMRMDSYQVDNLTHWIQTSNFQSDCLVMPGNTRIMVIHVGPIEKEIPKDEILKRLKDEAPAFMRTLIDFQLPKVKGRLGLPLVVTRHNARSEEFSRSPLETFIKENTYFVPGEMIPFSEFYDQFIEWLPPEERHSFTRAKVSKALPVNHPSGAHTGNKKHVANMSWEAVQPKEDAKLLIVREGKLCKDNG